MQWLHTESIIIIIIIIIHLFVDLLEELQFFLESLTSVLRVNVQKSLVVQVLNEHITIPKQVVKLETSLEISLKMYVKYSCL